MIAYIRGLLSEVLKDSLIIECNGLGYEVRTTERAIHELYSRIEEEVKLFTYYYVREDDRALYGFLSKNELEIFKLLITVNGVGPKGGLSILNTLTIDELYTALVSNDPKAISKANGIGQKTAQKIIIELKDKIDCTDKELLEISRMKDEDAITEAVEALTSLGYSNVAALRALNKIKGKENMSVEELLKAALKNI